MKHLMEKLEQLLELGGIKKDVTFLVISGIAVICSLLKWNPLPFDMAWVAIVLCGIPIILEAVIGLVTAFEMEAAKVGEDSSIRRMIRLVQSADAGKAKIVGIADRWATWIVVIALSAAAITWAVTGQIIRAVTGLVVQPVLLTGDHKNAARTIAGELQIREVRANCLPEDKLRYIGEYQAKERPVCMIGDGVNDAPALKKADVGIAMGGVGSDIAVDAADIALVGDEVKELPHLVALSKRIMTTIKPNMTFSMTLNFIAITLAIIGTLNPVAGALVHNAGSVLVITNSAFLLKWRKK